MNALNEKLIAFARLLSRTVWMMRHARRNWHSSRIVLLEALMVFSMGIASGNGVNRPHWLERWSLAWSENAIWSTILRLILWGCMSVQTKRWWRIWTNVMKNVWKILIQSKIDIMRKRFWICSQDSSRITHQISFCKPFARIASRRKIRAQKQTIWETSSEQKW